MNRWCGVTESEADRWVCGVTVSQQTVEALGGTRKWQERGLTHPPQPPRGAASFLSAALRLLARGIRTLRVAGRPATAEGPASRRARGVGCLGPKHRLE